MGFDTYINVGGRSAFMWRKATDALPRLLFQYGDAFVEPADATADCSQSSLAVGFRATAADVLATLETAGLGWEASVAAYSAIRQGSVAEAQIHVEAAVIEGSPDVDIEQRVAGFHALPPSYDLGVLGQFLADRWMGDQDKEIMIFDDIIYDSPPRVTAGYLFDAMRAAKDAGVDYLALGRAVESWALLYRDAPLLAGPVLMCVLLRHVPPTLEVSYILSEAAFSNDIASEQQAEQYLQEYWEEAADGLASYAGVLGRLFGVLAGFDSQLGRDFWFARAAGAFAGLDQLRIDAQQHSKKARGDALESAVEALLRTEEPELEVLEKNFRTEEEEIDLILTNGLSAPFWAAYSSPVIMVECKNWTAPVGVKELRVFESKMLDRRAITRIGIFISISGFTKPFLTRLKDIQGSGGIIFAVSGEDLQDLIASKTRLSDWLRKDGLLRAFGK